MIEYNKPGGSDSGIIVTNQLIGPFTSQDTDPSTYGPYFIKRESDAGYWYVKDFTTGTAPYNTVTQRAKFSFSVGIDASVGFEVYAAFFYSTDTNSVVTNIFPYSAGNFSVLVIEACIRITNNGDGTFSAGTWIEIGGGNYFTSTANQYNGGGGDVNIDPMEIYLQINNGDNIPLTLTAMQVQTQYTI